MRMRTLPKPSVLAAGALGDRGRFIFVKRRAGETETLELPHAIIPQGSNPVSALAEVFLLQLGIDAQVHEALPNFGMRGASCSVSSRQFPAVDVSNIPAAVGNSPRCVATTLCRKTAVFQHPVPPETRNSKQEKFLALSPVVQIPSQKLLETRLWHNAGSRKNKRWIPVLVFRITTKNASAKPAPGLGYAWLSPDDARKKRLARNAEWLR